jgi:structural maintenance of chromosome 1
MKDLIFRAPGTTSRRQSFRAQVTIVFHDDENDREIRFARAISPAGHGEYIVDGKHVPYAEYEEKLAEIGVLVKARNFLVFQGDVESIARKTPKELVAMLEQISSSVELAGEYDEALKAKEEAEAAVMFEYNRQKGFKSERRILKEQKEEAERFQQLLQQKAKLQTDLYLWQLFHIDTDIREQEATLVELRQELEEKKEEEDEHGKVLKEAKKKASAARRHTQHVDQTRVKAAAEVDKFEPEMIQTTEEIKNLKKKITSTEKQLAKKKKEAGNHEGEVEKLENEVKEKKKELEQLEADYEEIKRDAVGNQVTLTDEQEEELERVRQAAAAASVQPRRTLAGLNRKLTSARAQVGNLAQELEEAKKTKLEAEKQVGQFTEREEKLNSVSCIHAFMRTRSFIRLNPFTKPTKRKLLGLH